MCDLMTPSAIAASISDDDICSRCARCWYRPGSESDCEIAMSEIEWPGETDEDGYFNSCDQFQPVLNIKGRYYREMEVRAVIEQEGSDEHLFVPLDQAPADADRFGLFAIDFAGQSFWMGDFGDKNVAITRCQETLTFQTGLRNVVPFVEERIKLLEV